jgi:hypothetical protein
MCNPSLGKSIKARGVDSLCIYQHALPERTDSVKEILSPNFTFSLESSLCGHNVCLAQLREREPVGFIGNLVEVYRREGRMQAAEIILPQLEIGISKKNYTVKSSWPPQNGGVQNGRFVCGRNDNEAFASPDTIEAIEELLKAHLALGLPGFWEGAIKVFKQYQCGPLSERLVKQTIQAGVVGMLIEEPESMGCKPPARHHGSNGSALPIAGRTMEQIASAERQAIFAKPISPFKERLKIIF